MLDDADIPLLEAFLAECEGSLRGCSIDRVEELFPILMAEYPNHGITGAALSAKIDIAHKVLADVPDWALGQALIEAMRDSPKFMPSSALIRDKALPMLKSALRGRREAKRLLERAKVA